MDEIFVSGLLIEDEEIECDEVITEVVDDEESILIGIVSNCKKLNIRKSPNKKSEIITEVEVGTELMVDVESSNTNWYSVCTSIGIEGFCMKEYITIQE